MKANELRIGNLLMWEDESHDIVTVTAINVENVNEYIATSNNEQAQLDEFEPIPLTEEWLLKFGFKGVASRYEEAVTTDYALHPFYFDMSSMSIKINGVYQKINFPEYVHELQNLYFALIGEELEIK